MKVVVQRSKESNVQIDGKVFNKIENGFVILVGFTHEDTIENINYIVRKVVNLRVFDDANGIMNKSILDVGGQILLISQFTLYANTLKGNRPSYINALGGSDAIKLYEQTLEKFNESVVTYPGVFGADMKVSIINDGPVTIIIDSKEKGN